MFQGLSAFPPTPTDEHGIVQPEALGLLVERLAQAKVDSIGLLGSTGAYAFLTREERRRAIEIAREAAGQDQSLIVGIGALRTDAATALARDAAEAGADGLLLAPVSYTPLTEEEVFQHFVAVAEVTDLPLVIYNNPATTKFSFSPALIGRLSHLQGIAAVKMPPPAQDGLSDELARLRAATPPGFPIGYSGDWMAAEALLCGASAWYSVVAGLLPGPALALTRAAQAGDAERAQRLDAMFAPLWALFKAHGSFRVMYAIAAELDLFHAEPPRPVLPIAAQARDELARALQGLAETGL
ncbi:dihydrodipicolinate synthase family protein [Rhizobium sp. SSA_523]|uniref:dihydrodipicolinate synthase family protein n=1 Tax=Rhizobium sp. SSA_523 TaxID=2952477 RepID=UPI0020903A7D|nr:dihydrodipicolinate synthase family protein [Rhizobium sp. SSA_523]MCO5730749.1 dihydrodipicolinate synthase family protein [Rhizobium sp. SSA_523]WKC24427.1 dihydrodipicolinate synthase family protein [Rhizobium sp. SSA_523]